jgi:hypothetical protein
VSLLPVHRDGRIAGWTEIDDEDFVWASVFHWRLTTDFYAKSRFKLYGKGHTLSLARVVVGLDLGDPRQVDHVNFDRLDNRRSNLAVSTEAENSRRQGGGAYYLKLMIMCGRFNRDHEFFRQYVIPKLRRSLWVEANPDWLKLHAPKVDALMPQSGAREARKNNQGVVA